MYQFVTTNFVNIYVVVNNWVRQNNAVSNMPVR